jgi:hypothetical protein
VTPAVVSYLEIGKPFSKLPAVRKEDIEEPKPMDNLQVMMAYSACLSVAFLLAALWINDRGSAT